MAYELTDVEQVSIQRYHKYSDFRQVVDMFVNNENRNNGHCNAVIDAATLARNLVHNPTIKRMI